MSRSKKNNQSQDSDEMFDAFLKESISSEDSSTLDTGRLNRYLDHQKKQSWWMEDVTEESDDADIGLTGTGSKFLKKKKTEAPEKKDSRPAFRFSTDKVEKSVSFSQDVGISRDSLDDESLGMRNGTNNRVKGSGLVPALSLGSSHSMTDTLPDKQSTSLGAGRDTLEEIADKERFFKELERGSDETIDYSKLNRELDGSATLAATLDSRDKDVFGGRQNGKHDDYEEDSDEAADTPITAKRNPRQTLEGSDERPSRSVSKSSDNRPTMLSKVALMDSLESLGTKAAASRETRDSDDMGTIQEGTREEDLTVEGAVRKETRFEEDDMSRQREDDTEGGYRAADSMTGRGITMKTTGLGYTDTSREIEALHQAMQQHVGMATLDDTKDFTLKESSTQRTQDMTDGTQGTGVFGLKPVAQLRQDQRTVDDIMREVEELTGSSITDKQPYGHSGQHPEPQGFDLSPSHTNSGTKGFDVEDSVDNGYDISPFEKYLPDSRHDDIPPVATPRSRPRSQSQGRGQDLPDSSPVPAKRREKDAGKKPREKYKNIQSSGYGHRSPSPKRSTSNTQTTWSPAEIHKQKVKGTDSLAKVRKDLRAKEPEKKVTHSSLADNHLVQSVQSFANYIQDQFASFGPSPITTAKITPQITDDAALLSSSQKLLALEREEKLVREVQDWQDQWKDEKRNIAKLRAELSAAEREFRNKTEQMRINHEQEIFKLKQENYVLSAKVSEDDERSRRTKRSDSVSDSESGPSREQLALLEREVREQEKLLAGYQQENKRLYDEVKKIQQENKLTEEKMFRENQKLSNDVANLREQLSRKEIELKNKGVITGMAAQQQIAAGNSGSGAVLGAGRIAQLEAQVKQAKGREASMKAEIGTLTQTKQELELHIDDLVNRLEEFETRLKGTQQSQGNVYKLEKEIDRLNNKVKWYAENQEMLDRDSKLLKQKDEEIRKLKLKSDSLQNESGKRMAEAKAKTKEKTQDAKRIQDLERQVREMEAIVRKRHPNSLPVLMWAATAADHEDSKKAPSVVFLEKRIHKLEAELESKDDDAKRSLRVVEQKYNSMKVQYEERIEHLEAQIQRYEHPDDLNLKEGDHPHTHVSALQRELDSVKERYRKRLSELEAELEKTKKELASHKGKEAASKSSETKLQKATESESQLRVKALQLEVANQDREKQLLQRNIDKLQQEKQQLVIEATRNNSTANKVQGDKLQNKLQSKAGKGAKVGAKKARSEDDLEARSDMAPLPVVKEAWSTEKEYQPMVFAGQHVSDILQENSSLKQKMELLQFDVEQQRVTIQKLLAESEAQERRSREDVDDRIHAMRSSHQAEIQKVMADHAMQYGVSKVAELQGKLDTQEVVMRHLREQLSQSALDRERLSALQIRETTLESQVRQLQDEVREARQTHTPEMKHFVSLQDKIRHMEERHKLRERELQSLITQSRSMAHSDLTQEVDKWRHIVDSKNHELEKFRTELDSILEVLRELQRQGVVLPIKGQSSRPGSGISSQR